MGKIFKGAGKIVSGVLGGGSGTSGMKSAYKAQVRAMEEANRVAARQADLYEQQLKQVQMQTENIRKQTEASIAQARKAEEQINAANARTPDIDTIKADNLAENGGGIGSTMLTGSEGAEVKEKNRRKKTLLGA